MFMHCSNSLKKVKNGNGDLWNGAMDQMKQLLTVAPILGYPQAEGIFILDTDASNTAIGLALC